jgi:CPA2 family monovalent cation:H+ antiporter-2
MATPINIDAYSDALVVLGTAGLVVPLVRHFGISPILGYLAAGAVLGPLGLGSFKVDAPFLYWVTVVDAKNVAGIAELGVVFLLFLIGLELSYDRLREMRRLVFGLGGAQIVISTVLIGGVAAMLGNVASVSVIVGACLALSSTAIVIEVLSDQGRLNTVAGRSSFAVLLAQDLAVVPILIFVSTLGAETEGSVAMSLALAIAKAALVLALLVIVGRLVLRPLFRFVAASGTNDLFVAAVLFVIVGSAVVAALAGLSMALGAFVAGLLLAETEFRKTIETTIEPFKGILLGLFFFTVGMSIDFRELAREPLLLLGAALGLIALKAVVLIGLARLFRLSWAAATEVGLLLGPGGEFAFVVIGLATTFDLIKANVASFTLALTSLTMAFIPVLSIVARKLHRRLRDTKPVDPALAIPPRAEKDHAIVIGHGRVGEVVCVMLSTHKLSYIAIDSDTAAVPKSRGKKREVFYGDATNPELLKACGIMDARAVIVTVASAKAIDEIVREVRKLRPDVFIVSRARDAVHASHLYQIGVTDAVPETIEASLQLSEAALIGLGIAMGPVIASIHEKRDEFRRELQHVAGRAGIDKTHSIRPKGS